MTPPLTFALLAGSPAIDAGNSDLTLDQRYMVRPVDIPTIANAAGGNGADIGAVELNEAPQSGPNFVINSTQDHNDGVCGPTDCTLGDAINAANSNANTSTIRFDARLFATKRTIEGTTSVPPITSNVNISGPSGPGHGVTIRGGLTMWSGTVRIANFTFKDFPDSGFINSGGTATINSCTFAGLYTGIQNGGTNLGTCTLTANNCTFTGNTNQAFVNSEAPGTTATLNSCTIAGNSIGIVVDYGTVNVSNSLVVGNNVPIESLGGTLNATGRNILTGTAAEAGLDPAGLKDNGGPTPTIALSPDSPAINAGVTALPTDQRGLARDSAPDIGAFESTAPYIVALSPGVASDRVGAKRTFTLAVKDATGASDIKEVWLLINESLSWDAGATLIYVPSTQSPTSGLLYLRKGESFLPPVQVGVGARGALDNGAVNVLASDVKVRVTGTSLTLTVPLTVRDGLVGQNQVFVRVVDRAGATDPTATERDGYSRVGTYTVTPQFNSPTNSAPTLSRLTPSLTNTTLNISGVAPAAQTFTFAVKDENGTGDIESLWFLAGKQLSWTRSATFIYQPRSRRLFLRSDDGNSFLGGGQIGTPGILENSQVRLDLSKVKTTIYPDGKTLALSLPLQAKRGLLGQNRVWLRTQDTLGAAAPNGDDQGYVLSGTWNVNQAKPSNSSTALSAGNS